jgi:hypothetical protein
MLVLLSQGLSQQRKVDTRGVKDPNPGYPLKKLFFVSPLNPLPPLPSLIMKNMTKYYNRPTRNYFEDCSMTQTLMKPPPELSRVAPQLSGSHVTPVTCFAT